MINDEILSTIAHNIANKKSPLQNNYVCIEDIIEKLSNYKTANDSHIEIIKDIIQITYNKKITTYD